MQQAQTYPTIRHALTKGNCFKLLTQQFMTEPRNERITRIDKKLYDTSDILTPQYDCPEHLFEGLETGEFLPFDISRLKRLEDQRMIETLPRPDGIVEQDTASYLGLKNIYDSDAEAFGTEAAKAHAMKLLGGDETLFAEFEKTKKYDEAVNAWVWSMARRYEPETHAGEVNESLYERLKALSMMRKTIAEGLDEAGIGAQIATMMIDSVRSDIDALAQQCGHLRGMTPQ